MGTRRFLQIVGVWFGRIACTLVVAGIILLFASRFAYWIDQKLAIQCAPVVAAVTDPILAAAYEHWLAVGVAALGIFLLAVCLAPPEEYRRLPPGWVTYLGRTPLSVLADRPAWSLVLEIAIRLAAFGLGVAIIWGAFSLAGKVLLDFGRLLPVMIGCYVCIFSAFGSRRLIWPTEFFHLGRRTDDQEAEDPLLLNLTPRERIARRIRLELRLLAEARHSAEVTKSLARTPLQRAFRSVLLGLVMVIALASAFLFVVAVLYHLFSVMESTGGPLDGFPGLILSVIRAPWRTDLSVGDFASRLLFVDDSLRQLQFLLLALALAAYCFRFDWIHGLASPFYACGILLRERHETEKSLNWGAALKFSWLAAVPLVIVLNCGGILPLPRVVVAYLAWYAVVNWCAFGAHAYDKFAAVKNAAHQRSPSAPAVGSLPRVPECRFGLYALLGGELASRFARALFRHKIAEGKVLLRLDCAEAFTFHVVFVITLLLAASFLR